MHEEFREKIGEYAFGGNLEKTTLEHISSCERCRVYFVKVRKFVNGVEKMKLQKETAARNIRLTLKPEKVLKVGIFYLLSKKLKSLLLVSLVALALVSAGVCLYVVNIKLHYSLASEQLTEGGMNLRFSSILYPYVLENIESAGFSDQSVYLAVYGHSEEEVLGEFESFLLTYFPLVEAE